MPQSDEYMPTEELATQQSSAEESSRDAKRRIKADKKQAQEDFKRAKVALKDARRRAGKTNTPKAIGFVLLAVLLLAAGGVGGWYVTTNFLQNDRVNLENKLDTANAEITDLESKLNAANEEIATLKSDLAKAEGEIRGLKDGTASSTDSSSEDASQSSSSSTESSTEELDQSMSSNSASASTTQ